MKTNKEYKNEALAALKGNWAPAVLATLIYLVIVCVLSGSTELPRLLGKMASENNIWLEGINKLSSILILSPLAVGFSNAMRFLYERRDIALTRNMFEIPLKDYVRITWGMLLMTIKIILWTLLLIVPGILKTFSYAMTPYILVDNPELSASEAIHKSSEMMDGHRFDLFYLYLSFIGWFLLACLTCGIGFFWLQPYVENSVAAFYNDLKASYGETVVEDQIVHEATIVSE